ncbi:MAG: hypothetical protein VW835_10375 [Rickettsiales bacterium]
MRDNTERLRPPRFLWVPFELGRPFGAPGAPAFQTRVLRAALALLEREGPPPLLEDFPEDAPGAAADMTGWTCPIPLPVVADTTSPELLRAVRAEIDGLAPWHQVALERRGRSSTGVLGVSIGGIVDFLHGFLDGTVPESPKTGVPSGEAFRQAAEELKTFYLEAATAKPGAASSRALADWFWGGTAAGRLLLALHPAGLASTDMGVRRVAQSQLVPRIQKHRLG